MFLIRWITAVFEYLQKVFTSLQCWGRLGTCLQEFAIRRLASKFPQPLAMCVHLHDFQQVQSPPPGATLEPFTCQVAGPHNDQKWCQFSSDRLALSMGRTGKWKPLRQHSVRWEKRWENISRGSWLLGLTKLVVCCQIPSAKFVKGTKTSLGWGKSLSSYSSLSPPSFKTQHPDPLPPLGQEKLKPRRGLFA